MAKYSRMEKYRDLRSRIQNDTESDISVHNKDLSDYEDRLNRIDAQNFQTTSSYKEQTAEPAHARASSQPEKETAASRSSTGTASSSVFQNTPYANSKAENNENYTNLLNNEYLDEYLKEVKQYNIDRGNAQSTNTDLDILRAIRGETPRPQPVQETDTPKASDTRRYETKAAQPEEPAEETESAEQSPLPPQFTAAQQETAPPRQSSTVQTQAAPDSLQKRVAHIQNSYNHYQESVHPQQKKASAYARPSDTSTVDIPFFDDEDEDETERADGMQPLTMTREDIASQVQDMVKGQDSTSSARPAAQPAYDEDEDDEEDQEDPTQQRLLKETSQMRAQLDDYENNLTEVSDKMQHTNRVLNVVLLVLIIVLCVVLAVVIYWILSAKGIL